MLVSSVVLLLSNFEQLIGSGAAGCFYHRREVAVFGDRLIVLVVDQKPEWIVVFFANSSFHDENTISVYNCGQSMSNKDHGAIGETIFKSILNEIVSL